MLYVFHGSDLPRSVEKAHHLIESLRVKRPDAAYEVIAADNWNPATLEGHLGGQGLFSSKYIVFLDRVTENLEAKEQVADFIPAMNESDNIFIVLEGKLLAELKKAFAKSAEKVVESEIEKGDRISSRTEFNIFALADALGSRDPFKAWSVYRQAVDNGIEPENILGTLFWQAKSMMLAADAPNASVAGLSPFVFSKAKRHAANYSADERAHLLESLLKLYHDGHRGMVNMELGIERLLLV